MSKEQTPIDLLKEVENYFEEQSNEIVNIIHENGIEHSVKIMLFEFAKQYAQAKVLEALEREVVKLEKRRENVSLNPHIKYFVKTAKLKELDNIINQLRNRSRE